MATNPISPAPPRDLKTPHKSTTPLKANRGTAWRGTTIVLALIAVILYKPSPVYCEDGVIDHATGLAFLSCDSMRRRYNTVMDKVIIDDTLVDGEVWMYDLEEPNVTPIKLPIPDLGVPLHPLGIAVDTHTLNPANTTTLLIANVAPGGPWIHIVRLIRDACSPPRLHHIKTIRDPRIHTPNSIHVVPYTRADDGTPSFFVSNDHMFLRGIPKLLENYLFLPLADLAFYNARVGRAEVVRRGFRFTNGVTGPQNGETIYVGESYNAAVNRFAVENVKAMNERRSTWPILRREGSVQVAMAVDNLDYDEGTGEVIVGGHPNGLDLLKFAKARIPEDGVPKGMKWYPNGYRRPGSCVLKVTWGDESGKGLTMETLFSDDGSEFSTSTTGMVDRGRGRMMVTGLYEYGVLDCKI
ncbi:hypothetical protein BC938DRAFT_474837 [Jimgerdemannia flammicorona]|uniref:Calcium-dependent phosphotriesterase n=1 Tax=Jimgerdemannia flammicorona TaxID=994334 RepID=A0A433QSA8_9FUNG|nr:hypothetical protein BC938DRAFT_480725 [Jimgerdemannia flammicorona]RUS32627.1 hypothetical protein BC938DRAFT_474837 [Jimgerdemannia flammicorona]